MLYLDAWSLYRVAKYFDEYHSSNGTQVENSLYHRPDLRPFIDYPNLALLILPVLRLDLEYIEPLRLKAKPSEDEIIKLRNLISERNMLRDKYEVYRCLSVYDRKDLMLPEITL